MGGNIKKGKKISWWKEIQHCVSLKSRAMMFSLQTHEGFFVCYTAQVLDSG